MRRDSLKTIGFVLLFVVIAVLVICFDDIKAMVNMPIYTVKIDQIVYCNLVYFFIKIQEVIS